VVLDQDFRTARLFGASGTPSAVLVDAEGRIASAVAVGAQEVFALAHRASGEYREATASARAHGPVRWHEGSGK